LRRIFDALRGRTSDLSTVLRPLLGHGNASVRYWSALPMLELDPQAAVPVLEAIKSDPSVSGRVRTAAVGALFAYNSGDLDPS